MLLSELLPAQALSKPASSGSSRALSVCLECIAHYLSLARTQRICPRIGVMLARHPVQDRLAHKKILAGRIATARLAVLSDHQQRLRVRARPAGIQRRAAGIDQGAR